MLLPILAYGHPILEQVAHKIKQKELKHQQLIDNMLETMRNADGAGLAAPQVGESLRLFVVEHRSFTALTAEESVFINPKIVDQQGKAYVSEEGCLSVPGLRVPVARQLTITVTYWDATFTPRKKQITGMLARVIQHELDHLDGILHIHHLAREARRRLNGKLAALKEGAFTPRYPMILADGTRIGIPAKS